jgi:ATP-binding cassette subfamily B protein
VLIDGNDVREVNLGSLRRHIGIVFQDTFVFDTTVRENISIGRPGATDTEIVTAARAARLEEYVASLPAGYDTVLGERGVTLSHGQRQRLALARAALRHAPLLILDEPANGLDRTNATLVLDALAQLHENRTVIHITHNPRHAASADFIWYIEGGRIVERGTHDELLRADGHYTALWKTSPEEAPVSEDAPGVAVNGLVLPQATNVFAN